MPAILPDYINYASLKEFYTIGESCTLLGIEKSKLKLKCQEMRITPDWNENGEPGFNKNKFCSLHNHLYHEARGAKISSAPKKVDNRDPWA